MSPTSDPSPANYPKIELHVHLEGTVRAHTLLDLARRNGEPLPADTVEGLAGLYEFTDFAHFAKVWILTTNAMRTAEDFRQVTLGYAAEAAAHGGVYIEAIFSPVERVMRGVSWDELFEGYCDGAQAAREEHGVEIRFTPDAFRGCDVELAEEMARQCVKNAGRGIVGIGLGGMEADFPPEPYAKAFAIARDGGLGAVPHAGEVAGPESVRATMNALGADRIRHGIRIVEDAGLLAEIAARGIVLDVCPTSNLRTKAVASLDAHPLPQLLAAGVRCTINSDDPAMFDTDLGREHDIARGLGADPRALYDAGVAGALCDDATRAHLTSIGDATP